LRTRFAKLFTKFTHLESLANTTYSNERKNDEKVNQVLLKVDKAIDQYTARYFVDHLHSITNTVKDHYVKELDLDPENINIVYRGRKPILINNKNKVKKFTLLNVARQDYQKGQIFLLQAMDFLVQNGNKDIQLII